MHSLMIISAGLVLLAVMLLAAPLVGVARPISAKAFIPLWLIAALGNMWVGVSRAGYTVMQELPILIPVFGVPALAALVAARLLRGR